MESFNDLKRLRQEYTGMVMQALLSNADLYKTAITLQSSTSDVHDHIRKTQDELYHKLAKEALHIATIMTQEVQESKDDLVNCFHERVKKFTSQ